MRVGALASGSGTILQQLLDDTDIPVSVVVADRPCEALNRAERAGVPGVLVERKSFGKAFDRDAYSGEIVDALRAHDVDVVTLPGFGTVLGKPFFDGFEGKVINTHPALLPKFGGMGMFGNKVHEAVLAAGETVSGCSVFIVTLEVDEGPVLAQQEVPVEPDDTPDTLGERVRAAERTLFPAAVKEFIST